MLLFTDMLLLLDPQFLGENLPGGSVMPGNNRPSSPDYSAVSANGGDGGGGNEDEEAGGMG